MSLSLLSIFRPAPERVASIVEASSDAPFTYEQLGATNGEMPADWALDEGAVVVGKGISTFEACKVALHSWTQFQLPWVFPVRTDVPIEPGALFAFTSWSLGVWSVNACRIVYVVDDTHDGMRRYGFGYGTVGAHAVRGEEQFLIRHDPASDEVSFRIRKFSKPANWLLQLVGPITRSVQERFTRDALQKMVEVAA